jgi:hypothetical protein
MANHPQCPNCGSFATEPTYGEGGMNNERNFWAEFLSFKSFTFDNTDWVQKFQNLQVAAICNTCKFVFKANTVLPKSMPTNAPTSDVKRSTVERLAELEQLKAQRVITEEEYKRKREEIIRNL